MALKPAPVRQEEDKIESIINKGGKVAEELKNEIDKEEWTLISVRLPKWLIHQINLETEKRAGLSRNAWILESFQEKLSKKE